MFRRFLSVFIMTFLAAGCARTTRDGIISKQLPLTVDDLAEIRRGEKNHEEVLTQYEMYDAPKLQQRLNVIASNIANVSTRPHLPYKVYVLDSEEVNLFGGPGGYIYVTLGMLGFVQSESEIAGAIAHEVTHIANREYDGIPAHDKIQKVYGYLLTGSEFAKGAIGTYGTAANTGLRGIGRAAPAIAKRFTRDQEIMTDEGVIGYLVKAGYDPLGYAQFVDRLTKIPMEDVNRFVVYLNTHPPFQDRQKFLAEALKESSRKDPEIEFKKDGLDEIQKLMRGDEEREETKKSESIIFRPGVTFSPLAGPAQSEDEPSKAVQKHGVWF